jgi:hypothetical protein
MHESREVRKPIEVINESKASDQPATLPRAKGLARYYAAFRRRKRTTTT